MVEDGDMVDGDAHEVALLSRRVPGNAVEEWRSSDSEDVAGHRGVSHEECILMMAKLSGLELVNVLAAMALGARVRPAGAQERGMTTVCLVLLRKGPSWPPTPA